MAVSNADKVNILVVDDDDDIREIVSLLLAREGFAACEAANAEEALRKLTPTPDLVIVQYSLGACPKSKGLSPQS